jgi:SRSO17 transposase
MTTDEVRAAAMRLTKFHARFAPLFGKDQAQDHAYTYVKGLMVCPDRKSVEPIALRVGDGQVSALQKFLNIAPWDHDDVQAEIQSVFADELVPSAAGSAIGVVGVIDESGFSKKGTHSAGVGRQYNGRLGKKDNCQVGVYLVGVTPGGDALLDHQLYVPESWFEDTPAAHERRAKVHIPEEVGFQTKPEIAAQLIHRTAVLGIVDLDWVTFDEFYGRNGEFLDELEASGQRYVGEVPANITVWTVDPALCVPKRSGHGRISTRASRDSVKSVAEIAANLPPKQWKRLCVGQGAKGPLVFEFAAVRVWPTRHAQAGPPSWLLVRRSLEETPEIKYYLSNADEVTPLAVLAQVACTRHHIEEFFEDGKTYLGMADYETRSWPGWHHHMSLVGMAHLFIVLTRRDLKKSTRADLGSHGVPAPERPADPTTERGVGNPVDGVPLEAQPCGHAITY